MSWPRIQNPIRGFAVLCVALLARLRKFAAPVCRLFFARSPADVPDGVITIVVDALNGMRRSGTLAHVADELFKALKFNPNAPAAVARKILNLRIGASALHSSPNPVFSRSLALSGLPVCSPGVKIPLPTSTAYRVTAPEFVDRDFLQFSTGASAKPFRTSNPFLSVKSFQASECLAGKIKSFHRKNLRRRDDPMQAEMAG